jgi:uroporphyrinogen-III synthase
LAPIEPNDGPPANARAGARLDGRRVSYEDRAKAVTAERPLLGQRIVVTRARSQAGSLASLLREAGADAVEMPATRIEQLDAAPLRKRLGSLATYHWLIFTSQNAIEVFWNVLTASALDASALAHARVAVVGPSTAKALANHRIIADVAPDRFVAEALLEALANRSDVVGARVLYPCAEGARDVLPDGLRALGATIDVVPIYRSVPDGEGAAALRAQIDRGEIDLVTFTSASAVEAFVAAVGSEIVSGIRAASIGPVTSAAAKRAGFRVDIEAAESTIPGLVAAIVG